MSFRQCVLKYLQNNAMSRICIIWGERNVMWMWRWYRMTAERMLWKLGDGYIGTIILFFLFLNYYNFFFIIKRCGFFKGMWKRLWILCEDVMLGAAACMLWPWVCKPEVHPTHPDWLIAPSYKSKFVKLIIKLVDEKTRPFYGLKYWNWSF